MATLIGRDVWYVGGALYRGRVIRHDIERNLAVINCGIHGPHDLAVPATALKLSAEATEIEIEETIDYWQRQLKKIQSITQC